MSDSISKPQLRSKYKWHVGGIEREEKNAATPLVVVVVVVVEVGELLAVVE